MLLCLGECSAALILTKIWSKNEKINYCLALKHYLGQSIQGRTNWNLRKKAFKLKKALIGPFLNTLAYQTSAQRQHKDIKTKSLEIALVSVLLTWNRYLPKAFWQFRRCLTYGYYKNLFWIYGIITQMWWGAFVVYGFQ